MISKRSKPGANWIGKMAPMGNRPDHSLHQIVRALNGTFEPEQIPGRADALRRERRIKETPLLLRRLVELWQSSGPDVLKFSLSNPKEWRDVMSQWQKGMQHNPIHLMGSPGGGVGLAMNNVPQSEPYDEALRLFIELLLNPKCNRLAGPCDRCGNYYVPRRYAKNKRYCSTFCGRRTTAIASTREKRKREHMDKLRRVQALLQKWTVAHTNKDWKSWINSQDPEIKPTFLTRATNKGELKEPVRLQKPYKSNR